MVEGPGGTEGWPDGQSFGQISDKEKIVVSQPREDAGGAVSVTCTMDRQECLSYHKRVAHLWHGGTWGFSLDERKAAGHRKKRVARRYELHAGSLLLDDLQFFALFAQDGFAAQLDLVAFERQDFDQNLIAFL